MRAVHQDSLVCDFAQYYHVYDIDSLNVRTAATLACGLPKESRTIRDMKDTKLDQDTLLMASILDTVRNIEYAYFQSRSRKKLNRPKSVLSRLLGIDKEEHTEVQGFESPEEFEKARARLLQEE